MSALTPNTLSVNKDYDIITGKQDYSKTKAVNEVNDWIVKIDDNAVAGNEAAVVLCRGQSAVGANIDVDDHTFTTIQVDVFA